MFDRLKEDIQTVFLKDPAARSIWEVIFCYPGLHAVWLHRGAHWLWIHELHFLARFLSHIGRFFTGVEIHPGATIGRRFFVDHGMGVVIGETSEIGDDVLIYQGVVLGGTSLEKKKRHPTMENDVVIGTGAILLGPITAGAGARIGAGSVVIRSVPPGATVVGVPGRAVEKTPTTVMALEHAMLPDPVAEVLRNMLAEQERLRHRLKTLEEHAGVAVAEEPTNATGAIAMFLQDGAGI